MGSRNSKSMSGSYSFKGTAPAAATNGSNGGVAGRKKGSLSTNGSGPPQLSYPADPPDDENMNEIIDENIDLTIFLPGGVEKKQTVESNIPMMDLLINLAGKNKLNPASHSLVVLTGDKWKQIDFKANKTVGLLAGADRKVSVQLVPKKVEEKVRRKSSAQPFEMTYRFTVNLPHNQKTVLRISPKLALSEVRQILCSEKGFDPTRFCFILPSNPTEPVDDTMTVGDLKTSEINFVPEAMINAATSRSMPDLAFAATRTATESQKSSTLSADGRHLSVTTEKKAKKGFLSFLGKKDKSRKSMDNSIEVKEGPRNTAAKKSESFHTRPKDFENVPMRPKTMFVNNSDELDHFNIQKRTNEANNRKSMGSALLTVNENVTLHEVNSTSDAKVKKEQTVSNAAPKKSGKKRAAPPPPQASKLEAQTIQVEIEVKPKQEEESRVEELPNSRVQLKKFHSRNSSDSSGYHELTLSGADSPETGKVVDALQTTIDTASIDSAEHFNGDSGIRDISPARRRGTDKGRRVAGSRDSSVDIEKADAPVIPGRKKKRAPLPPPGMTAPSVAKVTVAVTDTERPVESAVNGAEEPGEVTVHKDEEFAAIQAMEEVTMKFNIDDSDDEHAEERDDDDGMRMVENMSIRSEDIDTDLRQRPPATFVAPPPPTEPPPEDSVPVDYNRAMMNQVDTIDIGVGEDTTSLGAGSSKSSPASIRSTSSSSNSSVNTLEDLSLAFKQIIAMGEETLLDSDSELNNDQFQEELKKAMPEFKEHISQLAAEGTESAGPLSSDRVDQYDQGTDSDASVIIHDIEDTTDTAAFEHIDLDSKQPNQTQGDRESSEITYQFNIDSVPADFDHQSKDNDESEDVKVEEIVEFIPARPGSMDIGSPRRIPDLDSPKEHRVFSLPAKEIFADVPIDNSTPKEPKHGAKDYPGEPAPEPVETKPKEKEEFVISLDELSHIDFSATKPGEQKKEKKESMSDSQKVNYRIQFRSSQDFVDPEPDVIQSETVQQVNQQPEYAMYDEDESVFERDDQIGVKTKCSELSFSPNSEGEVEHLMEEKSISLINLPAEQTPVKSELVTDNDKHVEPSDSQTYASSTNIVLSSSNTGSSASSQVSEMSPRDDGTESQNLMQTQYQQMQQQFTMWQNQLVQNQQLLATNQVAAPGADDQQSSLQLQQLQLQIQMQQQMLMQLQSNMHSLAMQNTILSQQPLQQQPVIVPVNSSPAQTAPIPAQTQILSKDNEKPRHSSPVQAAVQSQVEAATKPKKADAKYSKPKQKRFERQLDPREQLMLDIRSYGKSALHKRDKYRYLLKRRIGISDEEPIFV